MTREPVRPRAAILAMLTAALSIVAIPVHASTPTGSARLLDGGQLLAGTQDVQFVIEIDYPLISGPDDLLDPKKPVNSVTITAPAFLAGLEGATPGWSYQVTSRSLHFWGGQIQPGETTIFRFLADVTRTPSDFTHSFNVYLSDDGGATLTNSTDNGLATTVHVLEVVANRFTGPAPILDGDATEGQNATGTFDIINHGSDTVTVTPELTGTNFAPAGPLPPFDLASQTQQAVTWNVTLGGPGTTTVVADATGDTPGWGPSDAPQPRSTSELVVVAAADVQYIPGTLSPQIVSTAQPRTIDLAADLENIGGADIDHLDTATTTVTIDIAGTTLTASAASNTGLAAGQTRTLTFPGMSVPASLDGEAAPVVTLNGTDHNGVPVSQTITLTDTIRFGPNTPTLAIEAVLPISKVNGENDAATTAVPFDIHGTVTTNGDGCGDCQATAQLVEYDISGAELARTPVQLINDGYGNLTTTVQHTFQATTTEAIVTATAADGAGETGTASTPHFPVDLTPPTALGAVTGGPDGQNHRRIDLHLSERAAFPQLLDLADFDVEGHFVTDVALLDSAGINSNELPTHGNLYPVGDTIVLTLGEDMGIADTPVIHFTSSLINSDPHDRVGLVLDQFSLEAADGIIPPRPIIETIGDLTEYNDPADPQFYTNQQAPTVVVTNVDPGHWIDIYEDVNNDGAIDANDTWLGSADVIQNGPVEVQLTSLGPTERTLTLLSQSTDASGQAGLVATDTLTLDYTAPQFQALTTDTANREVHVTFSETIRNGRNAAADWLVYVEKLGRYVSLGHEDVSGEHAQRTIHISDNDTQWNGTVNRLTYDFTGDPGERYIDRAGNPLADFSHTQ